VKEFFDTILQFGTLNQHQIDFVIGKATELELPKDAYFAEAGKIPRQVGFIMEGVFRFCYYNNKGEEITNGFVDENNFVADYQKFDAGIASSEYIQSITPSRLLAFSKTSWDEISNTVIGWDQIVTKIYHKCLLQTIERRSPLVSEDATTRYLSFIQLFPGIVNRVPLSYIASYLGITQQSLSRIRKNIR
jgi:CRP-like cAMP-binding protein